MAFLAGLHEDGPLLAAGPLLHPVYRGLSILNLDAERARELKAKDPGVAAGKYEVIAMPWLVPSGIVRFARGRLPRSMREVDDG